MFIFFKSFVSHIFFCQIWSQNLKFSKLTEIFCRSALLYPYYDSSVYFFKSFVIHVILGKFGPKYDVVPIDWNLALVYIINIIC